MTGIIKASTSIEIQDSLEGASAALNFALAHIEAIGMQKASEFFLKASLKKASQLLESAKEDDNSLGFQTQVEKAVSHLQAALRLIQDCEKEPEKQTATLNATARTLTLLYPLIPQDRPLRVIPRKRNLGRSKGSLVVAKQRERRLPLYEVELGADNDTGFYFGFSEDISSGGLFIATYDIQPRGSSLSVKATFPGGRTWFKRAVVHWIREYNESTPDIAPGMGVIFERVSTADIEEIEIFMANREFIFYEAF